MDPPNNSSSLCRGVWSTSEHERFLQAIALYPQGPWALITAHIGTRSAKQVQTHAQKYQHKLMRHQRGLRKWKTKSKRPEHRVDTTTAEQIMSTKGWIIAPTQRTNDNARPVWSGSEDTVSECSENSDCSTLSELDVMMDAIEPVPYPASFRTLSNSESSGGIDMLEDRAMLEALDIIMSWTPSSEGACV
jgi:SHAQKYF class myb-like DNA-binding protein